MGQRVNSKKNPEEMFELAHYRPAVPFGNKILF